MDAHPDRLKVVALAAGDNAALLSEQVARYRPEAVAMATGAGLDRFRSTCATRPSRRRLPAPRVSSPSPPIPSVDIVLCASAGTAGLEAVLAAIEAGKTIALANKEVLVMAGALVTAAARRRGVDILPVDSEHNAIHQCLHGRVARRDPPADSHRVGRAVPRSLRVELERVGPDAALQHPTWQMGRKITIDSATLMNKGLEVIEAHWLFDVSADQIDVVIHPQSIVHSMVELIDGSVIAQLGVTDMRLPIQYAFSYPERWDAALPSLDLTRAGRLEFLPPATRPVSRRLGWPTARCVPAARCRWC